MIGGVLCGDGDERVQASDHLVQGGSDLRDMVVVREVFLSDAHIAAGAVLGEKDDECGAGGDDDICFGFREELPKPFVGECGVAVGEDLGRRHDFGRPGHEFVLAVERGRVRALVDERSKTDSGAGTE
ncbi:hypothetical protein AB0D78_35785 [Streptomyces avermitilis]